MDECRFDNWTRMLGALQDRRAAVKELAIAGGGLLALAKADLGFAQEEDDVLAEGCGGEGAKCRRNSQCCSDKCKRKRRKKRGGKDRDGKRNRRKADGECKCLGNGARCRKDAACCRGRCDVNERRCRCVPRNDLCNRNEDCCSNAKCRVVGQSKVCQN